MEVGDKVYRVATPRTGAELVTGVVVRVWPADGYNVWIGVDERVGGRRAVSYYHDHKAEPGEPVASASARGARLWATPEEAWTDHLDHLDRRLAKAESLAAKVRHLRADAGQARAAWRARPPDMESDR